MAKSDERAWARKRHAVALDRIAELKALPMRTAEQKERLTDCIEAAQMWEKFLEELDK